MLIIYTYRGLKDFGDGTYQAARTIGPLILVRPDKRGDAGLIAHEVEHVKQGAVLALLGCLIVGFLGHQLGNITLAGASMPAWSFFPLGTALHPAIYTLSLRYRLWAEVVAYRVQARHYSDDRMPLFARFIAKHYGLDVSEQDALAMLRK